MSIKPFQQCPFNLMVKCNYEYPCIGCEKLTKESKVIAPSASHNSASDESLQYLEMAKGAIRGKGYITAIGYIDAAIANLRT